MINIDVTGVGWELLRIQKRWLVESLESADPIGRLLGKGLVHLLDDIQDQAAEQIGPIAVFGREQAVQAADACPSCGCLPGDGITDGCEDPDGCGWSRAQHKE